MHPIGYFTSENTLPFWQLWITGKANSHLPAELCGYTPLQSNFIIPSDISYLYPVPYYIQLVQFVLFILAERARNQLVMLPRAKLPKYIQHTGCFPLIPFGAIAHTPISPAPLPLPP